MLLINIIYIFVAQLIFVLTNTKWGLLRRKGLGNRERVLGSKDGLSIMSIPWGGHTSKHFSCKGLLRDPVKVIAVLPEDP